ncbi:hypothetical protein JANAI62_28540 [Jannaschia pagri]|uniref:GCN5-related N-acetyltransferase n=1 Tax=Jannaschia pagri TaxID=2829797 RepID=A0ABQ4NP91_9RHOB|nr:MULTISPECIES: hypothetical protein [unclassified Jannaschia]GIT92396.1 hypothetical protein JANAI61_28540 [Jannaschia sp. AI_61]GIT96231.1 hypothetical protein JANAI62_28540 [Jannaschia sp. AI_62]
MDRDVLELAWLTLTRETLPRAARLRGRDWPVHLDHCFQRILLDHATRGVWYDTITKRPAYRHASDAVLREGVVLARAILAGDADLLSLNRQSLIWRGKASGPAGKGRASG